MRKLTAFGDLHESHGSVWSVMLSRGLVYGELVEYEEMSVQGKDEVDGFGPGCLAADQGGVCATGSLRLQLVH